MEKYPKTEDTSTSFPLTPCFARSFMAASGACEHTQQRHVSVSLSSVVNACVP